MSYILSFLFSLGILYQYPYSETDITRMQQIIVGIDSTTHTDLLLYDFNNSGTITTKDIVYVQRYLSSEFSDQSYFMNIGKKYILRITNNQINGFHCYLYKQRKED